MADTIQQKNEYSVAGDLLYRCPHFYLQENTYIQSQIQFIQTAMAVLRVYDVFALASL